MFDELFSKRSLSELDEDERRVLGDYIRAHMELRDLLNQADQRRLEILANPDSDKEADLEAFMELSVAEKLREVAEKEAAVFQMSQNLQGLRDELSEFMTAAMSGFGVIFDNAFKPGLIQQVMDTKMPEFKLLREQVGRNSGFTGFGDFFGKFFGSSDDKPENDDKDKG